MIQQLRAGCTPHHLFVEYLHHRHVHEGCPDRTLTAQLHQNRPILQNLTIRKIHLPIAAANPRVHHTLTVEHFPNLTENRRSNVKHALVHSLEYIALIASRTLKTALSPRFAMLQIHPTPAPSRFQTHGDIAVDHQLSRNKIEGCLLPEWKESRPLDTEHDLFLGRLHNRN